MYLGNMRVPTHREQAPNRIGLFGLGRVPDVFDVGSALSSGFTWSTWPY